MLCVRVKGMSSENAKKDAKELVEEQMNLDRIRNNDEDICEYCSSRYEWGDGNCENEKCNVLLCESGCCPTLEGRPSAPPANAYGFSSFCLECAIPRNNALLVAPSYKWKDEAHETAKELLKQKADIRKWSSDSLLAEVALARSRKELTKKRGRAEQTKKRGRAEQTKKRGRAEQADVKRPFEYEVDGCLEFEFD